MASYLKLATAYFRPNNFARKSPLLERRGPEVLQQLQRAEAGQAQRVHEIQREYGRSKVSIQCNTVVLLGDEMMHCQVYFNYPILSCHDEAK